MFKKRIVCLGLILTLSSCIIGCSSESNTTTESITTESSRTEETATDGATTTEVTTEEATTKPEVPKKEESLVWDGTTVYINDENGMKLFKEIDVEKKKTVEKAILKDGITYIDSALFSWCEKLTDITLPEGILFIGEDAFSRCESLKELTLPNSLLSISSRAFKWAGLKSIIIPSNVQSLPSECFECCNNLKWVICLGDITSISKAAFGSTRALSNIIFYSDKTTNIPDDAFIWSYDGHASHINIYTRYNLFNSSNIEYRSVTTHIFSNNICTEKGHIWGDAPGCREQYPCILCDKLSDDLSPHSYGTNGFCTLCGYNESTGEYISTDCLIGKHDWPDANCGESTYCKNCNIENKLTHVFGSDNICTKCGLPSYIDTSCANYYVYVDSNGNKVMRLKDLHSVTITDEEIIDTTDDFYIYHEFVPGYTDTRKISNLMNGHEATNNNTKFSSSELETSTESISYDTELIEREIDDNKYYVGKIFGKYTYNIESKYVKMFNIDLLYVVASHIYYVELGYDTENNNPISLYCGEIVFRDEP